MTREQLNFIDASLAWTRENEQTFCFSPRLNRTELEKSVSVPQNETMSSEAESAPANTDCFLVYANEKSNDENLNKDSPVNCAKSLPIKMREEQRS